METEGSSGRPGRPRPWLLIALALAVGLALLSWVVPGKSAAPPARASNPRPQPGGRGTAALDPAELDVRLEDLKAARPGSAASERNPFRFYVKPPPPPRPIPPVPNRIEERPEPVVPDGPVTPPPPPKIPLKYIGFLDEPGGGKVAAFSDCRMTMRGREGEVIAGQYRLVHIGVESVVMEYVDGRGRETIRMSGQECVGK
jgi:hypothetical protein